MPPNRRNHYRLLHVQPDAPVEIIKAAYRTLMSTLRYHPDLGGDHETAALINEAHAVLSDSTRRAAYDAGRQSRARRPAAPPRDQAPPRDRGPRCPFCSAGVAHVQPVNARCASCRAPLTPAVHASGATTGRAHAERRGMPRVSKADWALLYLDHRADGVDVRMRDLSLDGISLYAGAELPLGRRVRIVGAAFDVVGDIVSCRRAGTVYTAHARLVTAHFAARSGVFVSTSA